MIINGDLILLLDRQIDIDFISVLSLRELSFTRTLLLKNNFLRSFISCEIGLQEDILAPL